MTTTFVASNGDTIETRPGGDLVVKSGHDTEWVNPFAVDALHEFFQHQRDEQLGRWRDPENPDMIVYSVQADPAIVMVIDEREGVAIPCGRDTFVNAAIEIGDDHTFPVSDYDRTAARYFAAHPEPKPWMDAAHEEVWEITANGDTGPALATTSNKRGQTLAFRFANGTLVEADSDEITAGRRLYPEEGVYHPVHPDERGDE